MNTQQNTHSGTPITGGQNTQTGGVQAGQTNQNQKGSGTNQTQGTTPPVVDIDLNLLKTPKTKKTIKDFRIPQDLIDNDKSIIDLIMRSESMKDEERQYWFNLSEIMNEEQIEKLRDILARERKKLAEIDEKYGKKKIDPVEVARKNKEMQARRAAEQKALAEREAKAKAEQGFDEDDLLSELDDV